MIELNFEKVKSLNPCQKGLAYYTEHQFKTAEECIDDLMRQNNFEKLKWASWLLIKLFTKRKTVEYTIYSAKLVLHIFEEKYPTDKRPRNAIETAEKYLQDNTAADAAANAANAAAYAAADAAANAAYAAFAAANAAANAADAAYATNAAANTAYAADAAANAAANAAYAADAAYATNAAANTAYAADAAAYAANAADAADAVKKETLIQIIKYGLTLLNEKNYKD
jgi:hypothetical protein